MFLSGTLVCWALMITGCFVFLDYFGRFVSGFFSPESHGFPAVRFMYRSHILSDYYDPQSVGIAVNYRLENHMCGSQYSGIKDPNNLKDPNNCFRDPLPLGLMSKKGVDERQYYLLLEAVHWMAIEFCQIVLCAFVWYYELREFCRGRRKHWIERLIVQLVRCLVYVFFAFILSGEIRLGPALLGHNTLPTCAFRQTKDQDSNKPFTAISWRKEKNGHRYACDRNQDEKDANEIFRWVMLGSAAHWT